MAEGWAKALKGDLIEAYSAGVQPQGLSRRAAKVMAEADVDISMHHSKHVNELINVPFDFVVTVCDRAGESCPIFPCNTKVIHVGFDDPPKLVKDAKTEAAALDHYRRVRDQIKAFVQTLPDILMPRE
jgi:arsenate reductase